MNEQLLLNAGFTQEQVDALTGVFAEIGHKHEIEDVEGLEEELEGGDGEEDEEEEG